MAKSILWRNSRGTDSPNPAPSPESLSGLAAHPAACALAGAFCGFAAWLVYGCAETVLSLGVQWVRYPEAAVMGWQWPLIALVLGIYAAAGAALGAAGGWLFRETSHIAAVFTVAAALFLNLVLAWRVGRLEVLALGMTAALAILFFAALMNKRWRSPAELFSSPWAVSLLALSAPAIRREAELSGASAMVTNALALVGLAAVLSAALLLARLGHIERRRGSPWSAARQVAVALAVFAVFGIIVEAGGHRPAYAKPAVASTPGSPNVVLISMDTVRADHVSVYGYARDTTPNLRKLASRATVYSRAFAASDFTLPTHASIFTGLYPAFHGAEAVTTGPRSVATPPLGPRPATIAEMLAARGYGTVAVVANHAYLAPWTGLLRGFAVANWTSPVMLSADNQEFYLRETVRRLLLHAASLPNGFDRGTMTAADVSRAAERLLERMSPDTPFFLFLNYMDAHDYLPASPFDTYFPGKQSNFDMHRELDRWSREVNVLERPLLPEARAHLISQYDGGIASEDSRLGELLAWLDRRNALDNTLVIVLSDHGEGFGEHSLLSHGFGSVDQTQIAIPLIVKYPHQNEGRRSNRLVSQVDIAPTIFDLVGIPRPKDLPGKNLMEPESGSDTVYARASAARPAMIAIPRFQGIRRTILSGSLKLVTWTQGPPELYDLASDPGEEHNLYQPADPRAEKLLHILANWEAGAPSLAVAPSALDGSR